MSFHRRLQGRNVLDENETHSDEPARQLKVEDTFARLEKMFAIRQFADPPHPISILIQTTAPLIALAALWFSVQSYQTAREALNVGQRAYVTVRNASVRMDLMKTLVLDNRAGLQGNSDVDDHNLSVRYVIANLGNTPARLHAVTYRYSVKPPLILLDQNALTHTATKTAEFDIGPKSELGESDSIVVRDHELGDLKRTGGNVMHGFEMPCIEVSLTYTDIFGIEHPVTWSWEPGEAPESPKQCAALIPRSGLLKRPTSVESKP
jgi:hypothetical protein